MGVAYTLTRDGDVYYRVSNALATVGFCGSLWCLRRPTSLFRNTCSVVIDPWETSDGIDERLS